MNLGLGNLDDLRKFILPDYSPEQDDKDSLLAGIGKGVAALLEGECNREFARLAGAEDNFSADREMWNLRRYPVEAITEVSIKSSDATGWVLLENAIEVSTLEAGAIDFGFVQGNWRERVRVRYTGGYWFETKEPGEDGYPTAQPEGSFAVPGNLKLAWLLQCQHVFEGKDHTLPKVIKSVTAGGGEIPMNLLDTKLLPQVVKLIAPFIRYQLT